MEEIKDMLESELQDLKWYNECIKKYTDKWVKSQKKIIKYQEALEFLRKKRD